jgi:RNA polymerase sigma-70 factor (ECF subfamily)
MAAAPRQGRTPAAKRRGSRARKTPSRTNFPPSDVVYLSERRGDEPGGDDVAVQAVRERPVGSRLDEAQLGALAEQARAGDLEAFEQIVRTIQGPIRAFARRMMRDAHLGDDAAQETFVRIWRGLRRFEPRGRFVAWTFTVARNTCIEFLRRETRTPTPVEEIYAGVVDPMEEHELRRIVNDAVASLDEPFRSTFLLRETGLGYEELADALDCPVGTIRSRLHEARRRLAVKLRPVVGGDA